ncbi:expressed unknown protein [Seminavis robusta]|uniref:SET domain-containing protein n=1 Tax=Seminavis robusta TaxID=568900 RepID=A0A9N8HM06_9STRA|nr:expressed unknown protein [Seminavis robusta]|eukprot:Sro868_g213250.1 n/a (239) ;mRNA; r:7581-8297
MNPARRKFPPSFYRDVFRLLRRDHTPVVKVAPSQIAPDAGDGVFVSMPQSKSLTPLCLYPGIYTPGLPHRAADEEIVYMANDLLPPSGISNEDNAYILNLSELGGYMDGLALGGHSKNRLDENPVACAHMINHSSQLANAKIEPFYWEDVFREGGEERCDTGHLYGKPNEMRNDNSPWYFDGLENKLYRFRDSDTQVSLCCGVAVFATQPLQAGQELLLDYKLNHPLPSWAESWYEMY